MHGYNGFLLNDTAQLQATINVLRTFVDAGVQVWLRFAVSAPLQEQRETCAVSRLTKHDSLARSQLVYAQR